MLPFTRHQLFDLTFAVYNLAVWPALIAAYLLGAAMVAAVLRPSSRGNTFVGAGLAALWIWTGVVFHGLFFSSVNPAASLFGAAFVLQGGLIAHAACVRRDLRFGSSRHFEAWLGWALVAYAMALYPLLGAWIGDAYPAQPTFGITPCPVALFTWGLLLLTRAPVPRRLLPIPVLWSFVGGSAAFLFDVPQDWPLLFSSLVAVALLLRDRRAVRRTDRRVRAGVLP